MGGDTYCSSPPHSTEDLSSPSEDFRHGSNNTYDSSWIAMKGERDSDSCEFADVACETSIDEAAKRQRLKVYAEVLRSYEDFHSHSDSLEEANNKVLSYIPGSWDDKADSRECDVPNATSLLLVGPKSSGKSNLVNKISRVFEDNVSLPARAQVSCSSSPGDGTYFLHEYTIPRNSGSFCLYDTRGLSVDSSENVKMIKRWMTKGVCHGKLVRRKSDSVSLKAQLKRRARRSSITGQVKRVDFVIFVVNGLSVLEAMNSADETKKGYSQMITMNFNNPLLSFKDDKPAIVVTHGDLLSLCDRVKVRTYLGELLGVPPTRQIFDIPESDDPATTSAIFDLLIYCLDRADRNLPTKDLFVDKVQAVANLLFWIIAAVAIIVGLGVPSPHRSHPCKAPVLHRSQPQAPLTPSLNTPVFHHSEPQEQASPPSKTPVLHHSEPQAPAPATPSLKNPQEPAPPSSKPPVLHHSEPQAPATPSLKKPQEPVPPPSKTPVLHHTEPQAPAPATTLKKPRARAAPSKKTEAPATAAQPEVEVEVEWHKIRHLWLEAKKKEAPATATATATQPEVEVEWHKIRHMWLEE